MSLAAQNTEKGADFAAQAVAKVAITMNPEVAFPGQRVRLINILFSYRSNKWCCWVILNGRQNVLKDKSTYSLPRMENTAQQTAPL